MTTFNDAASEFGTVEHNGVELALTQQAYVNGTDGAVRYYAAAIDTDGNDYRVEWDTTARWDAAEAAYKTDPANNDAPEDESLACDWNNPVEITAL